MTYLRLVLRGFVIVALVAWNTRHIAALHYESAFATGFGISLVWWHNSRTAAHDRLRYGGLAYALGAGLGTLAGMWLGR